MSDAATDLYNKIADRKGERHAFAPYAGGNGRIDRAVDLILNEDFPRSGSLLDVGGATGNLGYALSNHFGPRWTLDIVGSCREPAELKGNNFLQANVDTSGLAGIVNEEIDLVVALDFIEHILDPRKFARECLRVLKPGGKVLINTPNIQYWRHIQTLVVDGVFPHTSGDHEVYHGGHTAFFNEADMLRIFVEGGFQQPTVHTRGLTADPPPGPLWESIAKYPNAKRQLSYADLIFSCQKPQKVL